MQESAPKTEVAEIETKEILPEPKQPITPVCPDPHCLSCTMARCTLEAFEAAVVLLATEMDKEKKNLPKVQLTAKIALDLGGAFASLMDMSNVNSFNIENPKQRYLMAAALMNERAQAIKDLMLLAGIGRTGKRGLN